MANLRISEFDANTTLNGSEVVLGVQSGNTTKISMDDIKTFVLDVDPVSIGSVLAANEALPDTNTTLLDITLNSATVYKIEAVLFLENASTDGLLFEVGVYDITTDIYAIGFTAGSNTGILEIASLSVVSDATGIVFVKMDGIISVTTGGMITVTARVDTPVIGTTNVLAGSYILATVI